MPYRAIAEEKRQELRRLIQQGLPDRAIAEQVGVSVSTVRRARASMQTWAKALPTEALPSAEELPGLEAPAPEGQPAPTSEPGPGEASAALPEAHAGAFLEPPPEEPLPKAARGRKRWSLLDTLLDELRQASADQVKALRELLVPSPPVVERLPKGPRRTAAFYISEELIRAIRAEARRQDVAPSQVVEQILWRAKQAGWLG